MTGTTATPTRPLAKRTHVLSELPPMPAGMPRVAVRFRDPDAPAQGDAGDDVPDGRSPAQLRHDVLVGIVREHAAAGRAPTVGGEAPTLLITGTIEALTAALDGAEHRERSVRVEHTGDVVPVDVAARMLCDAFVQIAVTDGCGHVLQLGRAKRLFNRAQRRALAARDHGCQAPGCRMPAAWCEAHHVLPWLLGGPTDVDNGILVCSYHHHEIHAGRLRVEKVGARPGSWRIVSQLQPARWGRDDSAEMSSAAALATATGAFGSLKGSRGGSLGAAAPASLAMKLPEPVDPDIELRTGASVESREPRPSECVPRQRRRPRGVANAPVGSPVGSTERRIRTLLDEQGRGHRHRGRADRLPRPGIVLRR